MRRSIASLGPLLTAAPVCFCRSLGRGFKPETPASLAGGDFFQVGVPISREFMVSG